MQWKQILTVLSLAAAALCFSSGCSDYLPVDDATILGESAPGRLIICEDDKIQVYQLFPFANLMFAVDSPLNAEDCSGSEGDPFRPNTTSAPVTTSASPSSRASEADGHRAAESVRTAIQDQYGFLAPIPGMPYFPKSGPRIETPCTPNTSVYMVNHRQSTVTRLETCPLRIGRRIQVGSNPLQLALTPDGRTLLVTRYDSALVFIDTATDTVRATMNTPGMHPNGIAVSPDGRLAYLAHFFDLDSQVFVVDLAAQQIVGRVSVANYPKSVFLTPDGTQAWVTHWRSQTMDVIDTLTMTVSARVNPGGGADTGLAFNPTGTRAYIASGANSLAVMDTATFNVVARVTVGSVPTDVAVTPDGSLVVVRSGLSSQVSVVDARTNTLIGNGSTGKAGGMGLTLFR
ncbi:MAG: hypothetical protein KIT09_30705 [Bryobacteraceae bacterium]|nr:hypothetical protein [Bryobacteraceae bacterium]